jgi:hypothetical protein
MPDFTFIKSSHDRHMVESAYNAITIAEKWEVLKTNEPEQPRGFMFTKNKELMDIMSLVESSHGGHSGSSLAWTMRIMQIIAKDGIDGLREQWQK